MIARDREATADGVATAYFPGGAYEYRKMFSAPEEHRGKRIILEFEGVYRDATVFVNGNYAGQRPYGYSRFFITGVVPDSGASGVVPDSGTSDVDAVEVAFGIRSLRLDPEHGLRINGETVKLRGACVHHDNGPLGAATFAQAEERRVRLLKDAGFNAIRMSHHPMSIAMLDACDRLGMLVVDEAFDMWTWGKSPFDYSLDFPEWWERDIEAMVAKDYNRASRLTSATSPTSPSPWSMRPGQCTPRPTGPYAWRSPATGRCSASAAPTRRTRNGSTRPSTTPTRAAHSPW